MVVVSVENLSALYVLCTLIAQFCRARRWSVTWARCVNYMAVDGTLCLCPFVFFLNKETSSRVLWFDDYCGGTCLYQSWFLVGGSVCMKVGNITVGVWEIDCVSYGVVITKREYACEWMCFLSAGRVEVAVIEGGWGVWSLPFVTTKWYRLNHIRHQIQRHKTYCHCVVLIPCWTKCQDMMP
jgi:hypothetical protein